MLKSQQVQLFTSQSQLDKAYQTLVTTANSRLRNRSKDAVSKVEVKPEDKTEQTETNMLLLTLGKMTLVMGK